MNTGKTPRPIPEVCLLFMLLLILAVVELGLLNYISGSPPPGLVAVPRSLKGCWAT